MEVPPVLRTPKGRRPQAALPSLTGATQPCPSCSCQLRPGAGIRRSSRSPWLLRNLLLAVIAGRAAGQGLTLDDEFGLLGEYFLDYKDTCQGYNGSFGVLDTLMPNFTRVDQALQFSSVSSFSLEKCYWDKNVFDALKWTCRGSNEMTKYFAARWTGYIVVLTGGSYDFELEADDGARVTIGNGICPGITCSTFDEVMNVKLNQLGNTAMRENGHSTYAQNCKLCASGVYGDCFITRNGCEPYAFWSLEGDGGQPNGPSTCSSGPKTYIGQKYLAAGKHPIKVEYFQRGGDAKILLKWKGPGNGNVMAPIGGRSFVFPKFKGMRGELFSMPLPEPGSQMALKPTLAGYSSGIGDLPGGRLIRIQDMRSSDLLPETAVFGSPPTFSDQIMNSPDMILLRLTGWMKIINGGAYEFRLESDDGTRLILGGRGQEFERVILDNDGVKERLIRKTAWVNMGPGLHFFRLEYLKVPGKLGGLPQPPGLMWDYKGPDTANMFVPVQTKAAPGFDTGILQKSNNKCKLSRWAIGLGTSVSTDCSGECFDGREDYLGDGSCDEGGAGGGQETKNFQCRAWNYDNRDCTQDLPEMVTTPKPVLQCYSTCPSGEFKRNNCKLCPAGTWDGYCFEKEEMPPFCSTTSFENGVTTEEPEKCMYSECCSATILGVVGWDKDCISFGTSTNCTHTLGQILDQMNSEPLDIFSKGFYDLYDPIKNPKPINPPPRATGYLTRSMASPLSNKIPTVYILNRYTGEPTMERVCPVGESDLIPSKGGGIACFEGPWDILNLKDPITECHNGEFKDNFCMNRKTKLGLPFTRCCTLAYLNSKDQQECRFLGIPYGTCQGYLDEYEASNAGIVFTAITNPLVLWQCERDHCNWADPELPALGCPSALNTRPWQSDVLRTPAPGAPLGPEQFSMGASPDPPAETELPFDIVGIILGSLVAVCCLGYITWKATQSEPPSMWYSDKATVVCEDVWMEPEMDTKTGSEYNIVRPKPFAFVAILEKEHPTIIPRALQLDPMVVSVPREAVQGAIQREIQIQDELMHAHRGPALTPESSPGRKQPGEHRGVITVDDIHRMEEENYQKEHHPQTHLQKQLEERSSVPAELRDHTVGHAPELVKLPDPFSRGVRGIHATGEDWESESSASSKSSYDTDEGAGQFQRKRSKRGSQIGLGLSRGVSKMSGVSRASSKSNRISTVSEKSSNSGTRSKSGVLSGLAEEDEDSNGSSSGYEGPDLPEGLFVQSASKSRPPAAARMLRAAAHGGTDGLHGGIPSVCT